MANKYDAILGEYREKDTGTGSLSIGDAIGTANRMLTIDGSANLADDFFQTIFSDIDIGGGNHIYVRNLTDATYAIDGTDPAIGFLDVSDVGGGRSLLFNIGSGAGNAVQWSDGVATIGSFNADGLTLATGARVNEFSTDGTLVGDSDTVLPTEKAVKTYVDTNTLGDVVDDLTPQLGGNLDLNGSNITGTGNITTTGTITLTGDIDMDNTSTNKILLPDGTTDEPALQLGNFGSGLVYESGALLFVNSFQEVTFRAGPQQVFFAKDMRSYVGARGFEIRMQNGVGTTVGTITYGWRNLLASGNEAGMSQGANVGELSLWAGGAKALTIDTSQKIGIGELSPDYKLDVNGTFGFTPGSSVTPVDNGDVVFELTNNTTLTVKAKGSDSIVRSGTITLT